MSKAGTVLASSDTRQGIGVESHYPREHLEYAHEGDATELFVVIQNHNNDAEPVRFDLFAFHAGGIAVAAGSAHAGGAAFWRSRTPRGADGRGRSMSAARRLLRIRVAVRP